MKVGWVTCMCLWKAVDGRVTAHSVFLHLLSWPFPVFSGRVPPCYFPHSIPGFCWPLGHHPATEFSLQSCLGTEPHTGQGVRQRLVPGMCSGARGHLQTSYCVVVAVWGGLGGAASLIPFFRSQERRPPTVPFLA